MSFCLDFGKDKVVFLEEEDAKKPSEVQLGEEEESPGLILENGEINWSCPCLGGMATGPCGVEFREAFSCFHFSKADPKGSDCYEQFSKMQECMSQYPSLYAKEIDTTDESTLEPEASTSGSSSATKEESGTDSTSNVSLSSSNT